LLGTWRTSAAKYAESFLTITPSAIVFGKDGEAADSFPINAVKRSEHDGGARLYEITFFTADGPKQTFSFYYSQPGQLRLANQKDLVWVKQSS